MANSEAAKQFIEDCGNAQVVPVAATMLREATMITIDNDIHWFTWDNGYSSRVHDSMHYEYDKQGKRIHVLNLLELN